MRSIAQAQRLQRSPFTTHRRATVVSRPPRSTASSNGAGATVALAEPHGVTCAPTDSVKAQLRAELAGLDRGIFGVPAAKKARILSLISELEGQNTQTRPTANLQPVSGDWRLLYSTITITGSKRTKLGLREFVKLGDFTQTIDTDNNLATNRIEFNVSGLSALRGSLTIRAAYKVESDTRVGISYLDSALVPKQLQTIFEANLDLLLSIFNPDGHLDITFLDADPTAPGAWRVGRDNKGNVFLVERPMLQG